MLDLGFIELDTWDTIIFISLCVGVLYYIYTNYIRGPTETDYRSFSGVVPVAHQATTSAEEDGGWIQKMKNSGRTVAIFYGSQTGTAEELAGRLAKDAKRYGLKAIVLDPEECEMEEITRLNEIEQSMCIFCLATYGEGDPTDNAQQLHEFLQAANADLTDIRYAVKLHENVNYFYKCTQVFGLGNKTYEHFNEMGKLADKKLEQMGATRIYALGLGDDDGSLEEDFMKWREGFWPAVCNMFGLQASGEDINARNYRLELVEPGALRPDQIFTGEMARLNSYRKQRAPFDAKNPFLAKVVTNRELHTDKSTRSCRHIEFDISGSRLRYEAGDHAGIFPTNEPALVQRLAELLDVDLGQVFKLINLDEDSSKKHPFPCPTTYGTALSHYVDIVTPVKSHVVRELANHTSDEKTREFFLSMSNSTDESIKAYHSYVHTARRSIVDLLTEHPTCKPPIDLLLEMLPRLQVRYYSISSSPRVDSNVVAITSVVVDYTIDERRIKGVCTNYLKDKVPVSDGEGELATTVPLFIRKSTLRLPHRPNVPVIMIGPGTGFAPFRGFIQDRHAQKNEGKEIGPMILYFGCRRRDEDYIYSDEIETWRQLGTLTEVNVAFSREQDEKVYVQHLLYKNRERTWQLLDELGAHLYVCGDARNMATDVLKTCQRIARECGGLDEEGAVDYMKKLEQTKRYQADVWS